jgi:phage shock protein PspC (stress-responsive transcriptional regulator)
MDKTININIAGTLFQIDEEAYRILRDYLQSINNRFKNVPGGIETVDDIEARIAEIFRSQRGNAGTITMSNVESMIATIGRPEDFDIIDAEPGSPDHGTSRKKLYRNPDEKIIGGVCSGIGAYLNSDPVLFRILFVIFTFFFASGIILYAILWIALPEANNDSRKRDMYGRSYASVMAFSRKSADPSVSQGSLYNKGYYNSSRLGNVFNELFSAIGRVLYILMRVIVAIFGVFFVLSASLILISTVMLFIFKYPVSISNNSLDMNLIYLSDFLKFIVNPSLQPWIIVIGLLIIAFPLLALIYWGVKMIFWFRVKDAVFSLAAFVVWILLIATMAVILFNEGISFAETVRTSSQNILTHKPDTLYIKAGKRLAEIPALKEINFNEENYSISINEDKKELYLRPFLNIYRSSGSDPKVELRKRSSGRNEMDAMKKTEQLIYNYEINGDTIILDDYFTIPAGRKWAADNIGINLYMPEKSIIKLDGPSLRLLHSYISKEYYEYDDSEISGLFSNTWIVTEDGLEPVNGPKLIRK